MKHAFKAIMATIVGAGLLAAVPGTAQASTAGAEKLRRLNIMLMVTSLRCRNTASDFQADFQAFEARHLQALNGAAAEIRERLTGSFGVVGANRALDRVSTQIANEYGQGHPWLTCADLKMVARSLANMKGDEALAEAADQLLSSEGSGTMLAWARR